MEKRKQFGLDFYKQKDPLTSKIYFGCIRNEVAMLSHLQFIARLDIKDSLFLIKEIEKAQRNRPYDTEPCSDSYEDIQIDFRYPHVCINEVLTISMDDFKGLLEEWIMFIESP